MKLKKIEEVGDSKTGTLQLNYKDIVKILDYPNATHLDDPDKVPASWGFKDDKGRKGFVWAYKYYGDIKDCNSFSVDGNADLLIELFNNNVVF